MQTINHIRSTNKFHVGGGEIRDLAALYRVFGEMLVSAAKVDPDAHGRFSIRLAHAALGIMDADVIVSARSDAILCLNGLEYHDGEIIQNWSGNQTLNFTDFYAIARRRLELRASR